MNKDQAHSRHTHLFGIVRVDLALLPDGAPSLVALERAVVGTKVFRSKVDATLEANRLNTLNADKQCHYLVVYLRMVEADRDRGDSPKSQ